MVTMHTSRLAPCMHWLLYLLLPYLDYPLQLPCSLPTSDIQTSSPWAATESVRGRKREGE